MFIFQADGAGSGTWVTPNYYNSLSDLQSAVSNDFHNLGGTDANTQLSSEQVQDYVGAMFSGNTETGITATYQDSDGTIDLVVSTPSNVTDGDKGDITVSSGAWNIDSGVVGSNEIASTSVTAGTYHNVTVTFDTDGRATYAFNQNTVQSLSGTSVTMNCNSGSKGSITLSGNTTITITNVLDGDEGSLEITNPSTYTLNINGSTGYTTEQIVGINSSIASSGHTTIAYWRSGSTIYYGFIYDN